MSEGVARHRRQQILAVIAAIPHGQVRSYGGVALAAGLPGRARLVARILADNDLPDLPWHRVLRANGRIAFAEGSAEWLEQAQRLRSEGVQVERGRVKHVDTGSVDFDAAIWGPG